MIKRNALILGVALLVYPSVGWSDSIFLGASDFIPENEEVICHINTAENYFYLHRDSGWTRFFAPVHLPHNVRIMSIAIFLMDDDQGNIQLDFLQRNIYSNTLATLCSYISVFDDDTRRIIKVYPTQTTVDNSGYTYTLRVRFSNNAGSALKLFAVKVNYETN